MKSHDVIIIGAGAAGLMCAIEAGKRGKKVLLLDSAKNVGEKIRISGGGRCNFTNLNISADNFLSQNPSFCISALKRFTQHHFISLVEKYGIAYHHKTLGQLFCDGSSRQIIDMLLEECRKNNVQIILETRVDEVSKVAGNDIGNFEVKTDRGIFGCSSLVIATGGLSIPKMGATDFGYKIARKFGLKIIQPTPALVPLTFDNEMLERTKSLSGVSVMARATLGKRKFDESLLFTHKGLSGPVILQISSYWKKGEKININLAPQTDVFAWLQSEKLERPKQEIHNILTAILPKNLVLYILGQAEIGGCIADINNQKLRKISDAINNWQVAPDGTEGFAKAEVTLGGIDTDEISSKSFESKKVAGLYFIGEVLDVTGHLGGYNFQWAWSSGYAAGQCV
ncbi:MAG: hypothetical protein K0R25_93 [Rickettsiaceae bacterium]|jgi:predicted Rossmann fold flavoprotein|nr:hypothetical protein [Rickettsiaceae bacterium]